jgi:glutathione reductase (NADPH)
MSTDRKHDFDLFVIGAGSGGVRAARIAAVHGARVGICEQSRWRTVIRGCVPKKLPSTPRISPRSCGRAASAVESARFSWPRLIRAEDAEIDRLSQVYPAADGKRA